jgi:hypothetical protein
VSEKTCNGCGTEENFDINHPVPYFIHEKSNARHERKEKALVKALVISIILGILFTFLSNMAWLWAWFQYDYVVETHEEVIVDSKDGGNANFIKGNGDITNGTNNLSETSTQEENESEL